MELINTHTTIYLAELFRRFRFSSAELFCNATFYLDEVFRHATFYLAEQFRHATFYLAEQFRHATFYLAELFRQIASPFIHCSLLTQWLLYSNCMPILLHAEFKCPFAWFQRIWITKSLSLAQCKISPAVDLKCQIHYLNKFVICTT